MRVSSTDVQNNFGKYLKFVEAGEEIIVTKNGRDAALIVLCNRDETNYVLERSAEYDTYGEWVTYEQFLELTEQSEMRYELIDGVVHSLSSPAFKHQHAIGELYVAFHNYFKGSGCKPITSPFDITLKKSEDNICVVQPDIAVICDTGNRNDRDRYMGIPDLVVEVMSTSTRSNDMVKKLDLYRCGGVKEYWLVDPLGEHILVYQFENNEIVNHKVFVRSAGHDVQSCTFEGLSVPLNDIFE